MSKTDCSTCASRRSFLASSGVALAGIAAAPAFAPASVREGLRPARTRKGLESWCSLLALASALGSVVLRRV